MKTATITLNKLVEESSSNSSGLVLFNEIERVDFGASIILEIDSDMPLSSSFLNSSIGEYLDKYGMENFKRRIKFKGNRNQFKRISDYISQYTRLHNA
jgi:hypothetical protein